MKEELKEEWTRLVRNLEVPAESIYKLLNPTDHDDFIRLVNELADQMFKLKHNGSVDKDAVRSFMLIAIQYLIEFEKDNKPAYIPNPTVVTYPAPNYPCIPNIPTNPSYPIFYCTTSC